MQNKGFKSILLGSLFFLFGNIQAQVGTWKTYMAYQNATIVAETPHLVFAVYDGSLLSYNPEDKEIKTYSRKDGLNDTDIQEMVYNPTANALVLVYSNANIDLFFGENNVYNLSSIKNSSTTPDKTVYNLELIGDYAYLSTAFGIVVIDAVRKEIKDTYNKGVLTYSVHRNGDYFYASTSAGVKKAPTSSNLSYSENWLPFDQFTGYQESITQLTFFKNQLVFVLWGRGYYISPEGYRHGFDLDNVRSVKVLDDQLVIMTDEATYFYSDFTNFTRIPLLAYSVDRINSKNLYWFAAGEEGVMGIVKQPNTSEYTLSASEIKVNSPKRNLDFYLTYTANKLLIAGGSKNTNRGDLEGTLMVLEDNKWHNFDDKAIAAQTGLPCMDFVSVVVDPQDPEHYFAGSWGEGLYEFRNNEFIQLYTLGNSSLQTANEGSNHYIRVDGMAFDKNNNLYMVNADVQNGLSVLSNQNKWTNFYYPPLATSDPDRILISRTNQKWFNFFRGNRAGIMVLDEDNPIGGSSEPYVYSPRFTDQQGMDINATVYLSMVEDQNGLIWVGTDNGLIYFTSAEQVGRSICNRLVSVDQYGNGYHPLEGVKITSIVVDAGNRKWIGSAGSGVFVLDQSNGSEIYIENFTTTNSLLLSDNITSIAINDQTGEVFIGTDKGLCSYRSEAVEGKPNYSEVHAFPNPVKPASDSQVVISGLMQSSTVKITDTTGNLIKEGISVGGQYVWNCADRHGAIVKAGIYLVFAATPEKNQGVVTKIMVIK